MFPASAQLHIPDGFLSLIIAGVAWLLAIVALAAAAQRSQKDMDERLVPLAGVMAAFIFAGQMINFPVAGGTSGMWAPRWRLLCWVPGWASWS